MGKSRVLCFFDSRGRVKKQAAYIYSSIITPVWLVVYYNTKIFAGMYMLQFITI